MDEQVAKARIRQLLLLQRRIVFDGGTTLSAQQYRHFVQKRRLIFRSFGIDSRESIAIAVWNYPYTYAIDPLDFCASTEMCPYASRMFIRYAMMDIRLDSESLKDMGRRWWSMEQRVQWTYDNLKMIQTAGYPEI